jgi:hypothetical protein
MSGRESENRNTKVGSIKVLLPGFEAVPAKLQSVYVWPPSRFG